MEHLVEQLTLSEKISLVSGKSFWYTQEVPRLDIPSIRLADGPNGVKASTFWKGLRSACLPCGTALGATFDKAQAYAAGALMAQEARTKAVSVVLGPTTNIARGPNGGRGFESFGDDPVQSGLLAAAVISGLQDGGIAATLKHLVCNDFEHERNSVNVTVSQRALREVYLLPFQLALRDANPAALMTSYNRVNGTHVSHSMPILRDIVRGEWGYQGTIMSDWTGVYDPGRSLEAGLDLEMPGPPRARVPAVLEHMVSSRALDGALLDEAARNVLRLVQYARDGGVSADQPETEANNTPETAATLRALARDAVVLLKNDRRVLPLAEDEDVAVIGPNAAVAAYSGGGSAYVTAYYAVTPLDAIASRLQRPPEYALGCHAAKFLPPLASRLRNADGQQGYDVNVYLEPASVAGRERVDTLQRSDSALFIPDYVNDRIGPDTAFYYDVCGSLAVQETGVYVFGVAVAGTALLYVDDELVVDNCTSQQPGSCFFGMGSSEVTGKIQLEAGRDYAVRVCCSSSHVRNYTTSGVQFVATGLMLGMMRDVDPDDEIARAVEVAKRHAKVVLCVGLSQDFESEGYDRPDIELPGRTNELVARVLEANPDTVVVNQSGTPVAMPWADNAATVVQAWYGGNETGNGLADVLFGHSPSGKLPLSFPRRLQDNPAFLNFRSNRGQCVYGEDVYVGHRYYEAVGRDVLFPFGHGLSYTEFTLEDLAVEKTHDTVSVAVLLSNVGDCDGAQVIQVYVVPREPSVSRPPKELKDFAKVWLARGASQTVELSIPAKYALSFFDEEAGRWCCEAGAYDVLVGISSAGPFLRETVTVDRTWWWSGL